MLEISRRFVLTGVASAILARNAVASQLPAIVNKDPNCGAAQAGLTTCALPGLRRASWKQGTFSL